MHLIDKWEELVDARKELEDWNNLPNGKKYSPTNTFEIIPAHCDQIKLCRIGQRFHGDINYWYTEEYTSRVITEYVCKNWDHIYPQILKEIKLREHEALLKCQEFIDDMQEKIDEEKDKERFGV